MRYRVPAEGPTGRVEVFSLGAASLPMPSRIGNERCLHVRLVVSDLADDAAWVLDARDQRLVLPDGPPVAPRYAQASDGASKPRIAVARGKSGFLDLFFPLGDGFFVKDNGDPFWASLRWRLRLGAKQVVGTTGFERLRAPEAAYSHYRPSQYPGGELVIGPTGSLDWQASWSLRPYEGFRDYRYVMRPAGFDVVAGATVWRYRCCGSQRGSGEPVARMIWQMGMNGPQARSAEYGWTARTVVWGSLADAPAGDGASSPASPASPDSSGASSSSSSSGSATGAAWRSPR